MNPQDHIEALLELAAKSPCSRDKRGALVVRDGEVIGRGFNAPVGGACTDDVCHQLIPMSKQLPVMNGAGWPEVVRSCGGHVEHAEAMAMRRAMEQAACSRPRRFPVRFGVLYGCELIHMNTSPSIENAKERQAAFERGQWDRLKGEIARPVPATMGIAKASERRGCPPCAVQASKFGVDAIWLLHEDGWQRWPMAEYAKLAGVV